MRACLTASARTIQQPGPDQKKKALNDSDSKSAVRNDEHENWNGRCYYSIEGNVPQCGGGCDWACSYREWYGFG